MTSKGPLYFIFGFLFSGFLFIALRCDEDFVRFGAGVGAFLTMTVAIFWDQLDSDMR